MRGLCTAIAAFALGCSTVREPYRCETASQCVSGGIEGVCEPTGYCSFPDGSCPGGRKYEDRAGEGLGGTCIEPVLPMPDAPVVACGGAGESCCSEPPACAAGLSCQVGTCQSCVTDITFGRHFGCVLRDDNTVWCVGANNRGQIGIGLAASTIITSWMQTLDLATSLPVSDATMIRAGYEFACAIRTGGTVACWGANGQGQLGRNDTTQSAAAAPVLEEATGMPLENIVEISAGDDHACGRNAAGNVWCWGRNDGGQIGDGTIVQRLRAVPVLTGQGGTPITGAIALTSSADHTCLRQADNATSCWGRNGQGQLGDGTGTTRTSPVSVGMTKSIDAGAFAMTCRVAMDDTVACNGSTWRYRLGDGRTNDPQDAESRATSPVTVLTERGGNPLTNVKQVVVGGVPCALLADGSVRCWGDNTHGQNGTGALAPFPAPVLLADGKPLDRVTRLVGQYSHHCAFRDTGEIVCWGRNRTSEMGNGLSTDLARATPLSFACP